MRKNTIHTQFDEDQIENERERKQSVATANTRKSSFGFAKTLRAKQRMSNRRNVGETN